MGASFQFNERVYMEIYHLCMLLNALTKDGNTNIFIDTTLSRVFKL